MTAGPSAPEFSAQATAYVELPALPQSPFWARRHAHAVLGAWQIPPDTLEATVLLVTELVTNAIAAMTGPARVPSAASAGPITQTLRLLPDRLVIEVFDNDPNPPVLANADLESESGRGLMLVDILSKEWGHHFPASGGKVVFCVLAT